MDRACSEWTCEWNHLQGGARANRQTSSSQSFVLGNKRMLCGMAGTKDERRMEIFIGLCGKV